MRARRAVNPTQPTLFMLGCSAAATDTPDEVTGHRARVHFTESELERGEGTGSSPSNCHRIFLRFFSKILCSRLLVLRSSQTLDGSLSAVSTLLIARVGALFSIFRNLQYWQSFAPLQSPNSCKHSSNVFVVMFKYLPKMFFKSF